MRLRLIGPRCPLCAVSFWRLSGQAQEDGEAREGLFCRGGAADRDVPRRWTVVCPGLPGPGEVVSGVWSLRLGCASYFLQRQLDANARRRDEGWAGNTEAESTAGASTGAEASSAMGLNPCLRGSGMAVTTAAVVDACPCFGRSTLRCFLVARVQRWVRLRRRWALEPLATLFSRDPPAQNPRCKWQRKWSNPNV